MSVCACVACGKERPIFKFFTSFNNFVCGVQSHSHTCFQKKTIMHMKKEHNFLHFPTYFFFSEKKIIITKIGEKTVPLFLNNNNLTLKSINKNLK